MRLLKKQKPFRAYVPLVLNGKVVQWYFESGEAVITMDVPMRRYAKKDKTDWTAQHVRIAFTRKKRSCVIFDQGADFPNRIDVTELYYSCDNNRVTFEEGYVPVFN